MLFDNPEYSIQWAGRNLRTVSISGFAQVKAKERQPSEPTMVQIWQALRRDGTTACNTERPIAFIVPGNNSSANLGTTPHRWRYCQKDGFGNITQDVVYETDVSWFHAGQWEWDSRKRERTNDDFIWDFQMEADFLSEHVLYQEYRNPAGWRIVVFADDIIIGYFWIEI